MDHLPDDDLPYQELVDALVRALHEHRDTLVQMSLQLKDLLANADSEHRQAVAAQLGQYLADMARGTQAGNGSERNPP